MSMSFNVKAISTLNGKNVHLFQMFLWSMCYADGMLLTEKHSCWSIRVDCWPYKSKRMINMYIWNTGPIIFASTGKEPPNGVAISSAVLPLTTTLKKFGCEDPIICCRLIIAVKKVWWYVCRSMQVSTRCYQILYCIFPQTETSENYGKVSLLYKGWWLRHFLQNAFVEVRFCVASCFLPASTSSRVYCSPSTGDTPPLPTPANSSSNYFPQSARFIQACDFLHQFQLWRPFTPSERENFLWCLSFILFFFACSFIFYFHFRCCLVWIGPYRWFKGAFSNW